MELPIESYSPIAEAPKTLSPKVESLEVPAPSTAPEDEPSSRDGLSTFEVSTSKWKTLFTFVFGDVFGMVLLFGSVHLLMQTTELAGGSNIYPLFFILLPGVLATFFVAGLYRQRFCHPALEMPRVALATGTTAGTAAVTAVLATGDVRLGLLIATWGALGMVVLPIARVLTRVFWSTADWWGIPAVVITSATSGQDILRTLRVWPEIGLRPSIVLKNPELHENPGSSDSSHELAPELAQRFDIPYAVVAIPSMSHEDRATLLLRYSKFFDHVLVLPDDRNLNAMWTTSDSGDGLFTYSVRHSSLRPGIQYMKRAFDVVGAALITVLLLPVLAMIALAIKRGSTGPVFYRQERMGKGGRIFTVLKFRTMYEDADEKLAQLLQANPDLRQEYERYHKMQNDPRVTAVGRFLRRYSLDELPQFFNVLAGEMSLVGPRAYMPSELPDMSRLSQAVLQVPPGITGLWQVSGRNELSFRERIELDIHYTQNWSLWLDLYLMARTIPAVLSGDGAS